MEDKERLILRTGTGPRQWAPAPKQKRLQAQRRVGQKGFPTAGEGRPPLPRGSSRLRGEGKAQTPHRRVSLSVGGEARRGEGEGEATPVPGRGGRDGTVRHRPPSQPPAPPRGQRACAPPAAAAAGVARVRLGRPARLLWRTGERGARDRGPPPLSSPPSPSPPGLAQRLVPPRAPGWGGDGGRRREGSSVRQAAPGPQGSDPLLRRGGGGGVHRRGEAAAGLGAAAGWGAPAAPPGALGHGPGQGGALGASASPVSDVSCARVIRRYQSWVYRFPLNFNFRNATCCVESWGVGWNP